MGVLNMLQNPEILPRKVTQQNAWAYKRIFFSHFKSDLKLFKVANVFLVTIKNKN